MSTETNDLINKEINSTLRNMKEIKLKNDLVKSKIDERKTSLINELEEKTNNELKKIQEERSKTANNIFEITNAINSNNLQEALKLLEKVSI